MDILNIIEPNQTEKLLIMRKEMEEQEQYRRFMERRHMFSQYGEELLECIEKLMDISSYYIIKAGDKDETDYIELVNKIQILLDKFHEFDDVKPKDNLFEELGKMFKPNEL